MGGEEEKIKLAQFPQIKVNPEIIQKKSMS